ncbi:MAG: DMT family transporter [Paracoccaceae bacterium]
MHLPADAAQRSNLRACLAMTLGMAFFGAEDLFLRNSALALPPGQVLATMGAGGFLLFAALARQQGQPLVSRAFLHPTVMIRNLGEALASMAFILALSLLPLSLNAALLQAAPLVLTAGAALFLGERVGWRRWAAVGAGFGGVLLIVRPGTGDFQWPVLLTLFSVLMLTARDLATRRAPADIGTAQLTAWAYAAIVPAGLSLMLLMGQAPVRPQASSAVDLIGALLCGVFGYYAITAATRLGEASVIAPFRYTRLVFSLALAIVVLNERPDALTLAGAAIVIASGLYTFAREARRRRGAALRMDASPAPGQPL